MMRRFLAAFTILVIGIIMLTPAIYSRSAYAADGCEEGATLNGLGVCVCPDGSPLEESDGTCSTDPFSQACIDEGSDASACHRDPTKNPVSGKDGVIFKAINIFSFIIGAASVIMVLIGGLRYVIAGGDSNGIATAKNTILYAVIGIVVFILSRAIIVFVVNKL